MVTVNLCWFPCFSCLLSVCLFFSLSPSSPIIYLTSDLSPYVTTLHVSDLLSLTASLPPPVPTPPPRPSKLVPRQCESAAGWGSAAALQGSQLPGERQRIRNQQVLHRSEVSAQKCVFPVCVCVSVENGTCTLYNTMYIFIALFLSTFVLLHHNLSLSSSWVTACQCAWKANLLFWLQNVLM